MAGGRRSWGRGGGRSRQELAALCARLGERAVLVPSVLGLLAGQSLSHSLYLIS